MTSETKAPPEWPPFVRDFVLPFLHSTALRPVLIAILGHVALLWALTMLRVLDGPRLEDLSLVFLGVAVSAFPIIEELRIDRRPGAVTASVVASWGMGIVMAGVMRGTGVM